MTLSQTIMNVARDNFSRFVKFLCTGFVAFLFSELVIFLGNTLFSTRVLVQTDIVAAITSIALGFYLNDLWTTRHAGFHPKGIGINLIRLGMYEGIYALGNVIAYSVQLSLFYYLSMNPLLGNMIGAIVATPVNYIVSMKFVWRINVFANKENA